MVIGVAVADLLYLQRFLRICEWRARLPAAVHVGLPSRVELEILRVIDTSEATHLRYRVRR